MKRLVVGEHGRIYRWDRGRARSATQGPRLHLEAGLFQQLQQFDYQHGKKGGQVFTWYAGFAQAQQWVGVIQLPGLQVEVLPKVDTHNDDEELGKDRGNWHEVRKNLLYMLAVAGDVPVRPRDMAKLTSRKAPLSETLAAPFADRLLGELLRGPEREYRPEEENLRRFRGKLIMNQHVLKNAAHRERFYCRYDEFSDDTPMNRVFKAACTVLLGTTRTPPTQDTLRHCLLVLQLVRDVPISDSLFDRAVINRQNERFADVFRFCRLILSGHAPTISAGHRKSFSLLFDMNQVFERFIAAFVRRHVLPRMDGYHLFPQAQNQRRYLMSTKNGGVSTANGGVLQLRPDMLLRHDDSKCFLVIDTKWKKLPATVKRRRSSGVGRADLYQLHAYAHRYGCKHGILLFPGLPGANRHFDILDEYGDPNGREVSVCFVDLNRDLHSESVRRTLADELETLIHSGFPDPNGATVCATDGTATLASGGAA